MSAMSQNAAPSQSQSQLVPTQKAKQKPAKQYKLKHGSLEVTGYTDDEPMVMKLKVVLRTGITKIVCKYII